MLWLTCNATQKIGADYNKKTATKGSYYAEICSLTLFYIDTTRSDESTQPQRKSHELMLAAIKINISLGQRFHMPHNQL